MSDRKLLEPEQLNTGRGNDQEPVQAYGHQEIVNHEEVDLEAISELQQPQDIIEEKHYEPAINED